MPGYVAEAGLAEKILPIEQIAPTILREVRKKNSRNIREVRMAH